MKAPESLPPTPRTVKLKSGTVFGRVFVWILTVCLFVGIPLGMSHSVGRLRTLMNSGKTITATVDSSRVSHGKSDTYYISVSFSENGHSVYGERMVPMRVYNQYSGEPTVPVATMPGNPTDYEVGGVNQDLIDSTQDVWLMFGGMFGLMVLAGLLGLELSIRNESRLLSMGTEVNGEVCSVNVIKGKGVATNVVYRYETPLGVREKKCSLAGDQADDYQPGTAIPVLYQPDKDTNALPTVSFQLVDLVW